MPLRQNDLRSPPGTRHARRRVGRGNAAGGGTYAGRGLKGQKARSGKDLRPGFEGGQIPTIRRLAHRRGFRNLFRVTYTPINLFRLNAKFDPNAEVTADSLVAVGLLKDSEEPFKVLAAGALDRPLVVRAAKVSPAARTKIESAGGRVEEPDAASADGAKPD